MMNSILLYAVLALMIGAAILTVLTDRLLTAVLYAGVLSATAAFVYLLLGAPDVALAEAVIGSTLATVIFLVTLKKYRIFTIYLTGRGAAEQSARVLSVVEQVLQKQEIEPHVLHSSESAPDLLTRPGCDLIVEQRKEEVIIYGEESGAHLHQIMEVLSLEHISVTLKDSLTNSIADYKEEHHP